MGAGFAATAITDGPEKVPAVERFRSAGIGLIQLGDPYEDAVLHPPPVVRPRLAGRPVSPAAARQPVAQSVTARNLRS
jgi:hypothetical protein